MGYTTKFSGVLKFANELTMAELVALEQIIGDDKPADFDHYIDLEITTDKSGIKWNGTEKTYEMPAAVNYIIDKMKLQFPDFGLTGYFVAQGEEIGDVWKLEIVDGHATSKNLV